jgi:hypothetical protein
MSAVEQGFWVGAVRIKQGHNDMANVFIVDSQSSKNTGSAENKGCDRRLWIHRLAPVPASAIAPAAWPYARVNQTYPINLSLLLELYHFL